MRTPPLPRPLQPLHPSQLPHLHTSILGVFRRSVRRQRAEQPVFPAGLAGRVDAVAEVGGAFSEVARGGFDGNMVLGAFGGRSGGCVAALGAEVADGGSSLGCSS